MTSIVASVTRFVCYAKYVVANGQILKSLSSHLVILTPKFTAPSVKTKKFFFAGPWLAKMTGKLRVEGKDCRRNCFFLRRVSY